MGQSGIEQAISKIVNSPSPQPGIGQIGQNIASSSAMPPQQQGPSPTTQMGSFFGPLAGAGLGFMAGGPRGALQGGMMGGMEAASAAAGQPELGAIMAPMMMQALGGGGGQQMQPQAPQIHPPQRPIQAPPQFQMGGINPMIGRMLGLG